MATIVVNPKVITVHEIGYAESGYFTEDGLDYVNCGRHFVKYASPIRRSIVTTSIKTIGDFELPVYSFHRHVYKKWLFFTGEKWNYRKIGMSMGCIITFLNGSRMFVKESESTIKGMIESEQL